MRIYAVKRLAVIDHPLAEARLAELCKDPNQHVRNLASDARMFPARWPGLPRLLPQPASSMQFPWDSDA